MFIFWKKTPLSSRIYSDPYCVHIGSDRLTLTPTVKESYREDGKPRNRTLWRPSRGLRTCCIADINDPTARVAWWQEFEQDFLRVVTNLEEADGDRLLDHYEWLRDELAKIVPQPSLADETLWWCMMGLPQDPRPGERPHEQRARLVEEARRSMEERLRPLWEQERRYWQREAETARRVPPRDPPHAEAGGTAPGPHGSAQAQSGRRNAADATPWFFRQLGLTWPCTEQDVKVAWRRGVKVHHPDQGGSNAAFIDLKGAYDAAMDFLKRAAA
ncbi:hypothetical protein BE04_39475 [Sorangium cellulosum]|uniref:J domain-containing protein n=1 Tax=Sorangium cellulosum TaxID=56 RepID=A0A150PQ48_SORCE|nr:hypothetical protein BE04_39475 [Sorangium cellulosum]